MATVVVTVAWRGCRRDLAVPADVPVGDLLRPLAAAVSTGPRTPGSRGTGGAALDPPPPRSRGTGGAAQDPPGPARALALAPLGGLPLPAGRTLAACGVGDGAVLVLIDGRPPVADAGRPT